MSFIIPDYDLCDIVTFYVRKDFSDNPCIMTHYIDRNEPLSLLFYIREYMDTDVAVKRPATPAKLIMTPIPADYEPLY